MSSTRKLTDVGCGVFFIERFRAISGGEHQVVFTYICCDKMLTSPGISKTPYLIKAAIITIKNAKPGSKCCRMRKTTEHAVSFRSSSCAKE